MYGETKKSAIAVPKTWVEPTAKTLEKFFPKERRRHRLHRGGPRDRHNGGVLRQILQAVREGDWNQCNRTWGGSCESDAAAPSQVASVRCSPRRMKRLPSQVGYSKLLMESF